MRFFRPHRWHTFRWQTCEGPVLALQHQDPPPLPAALLFQCSCWLGSFLFYFSYILFFFLSQPSTKSASLACTWIPVECRGLLQKLTWGRSPDFLTDCWILCSFFFLSWDLVLWVGRVWVECRDILLSSSLPSGGWLQWSKWLCPQILVWNPKPQCNGIMR